MCYLCKAVRWLIKSDMSITSKSKKLHIDSTKRTNLIFIATALKLAVLTSSIRNKGVIWANIHTIK